MEFDLKSYLYEKQELVNQSLEGLLPVEGDYPKEIIEAMRYSIFAGGKRLRPILTIGACETAGGNVQDAMKVACAIECIHTYSLIHDDLPALDDDDFRRGMPTCHKVYGEAIAILAGDALLTYAFELLSDMDYSKSIVKIIREVSCAAGPKGMIAGQVADMLSEKGQREKTTDLLDYIHKNKTGALFKASIKSGALIAGCTDVELVAFDSYAHHFGLAFQIVDDILDIEGTASELGKPIGSDERNQKLTYPLLYGLEKSKEMALEHVNSAVNSLAIFGKRSVPLVSLAQYVLTRRK